MDDIINEVIKLIKDKKLVLFIGAGVPASIGMPTWRELIDFMGNELGLKSIKSSSYSDFLQIASYYMSQKKSLKGIQDYLKDASTKNRLNLNKSSIYKSIVNLKIGKVYTTNYDHLLEVAYHRYHLRHKTLRTIKDFADIENDYQIIKYHGDVDYARNIVLTEESYFERLNFDHPLDIKLKNDLIGNSVLFIGYSLSDINIRFLIYKINKLWQDHNEVKPMKSYIFLSEVSPIQSELLDKYGVKVINGTSGNLTKDLELFLNVIVEKIQNEG